MARDSSSKHTTVRRIFQTLLSRFGPQHWWPASTPLEVAVGAVLTQNTAWSNVEKAMVNLKRARLLDVERMLARRRALPRLLKPAGCYNIKARRLVALLEFFHRQYRSDFHRMKLVPRARLRRQLLAVPGIGQETADSILLYALGKKVFVVDRYTRRIFGRHRLIKVDADYDQVQEFFSRRLPGGARTYNEFHALIVRLAKTNCWKNEPDCNTCPLNFLPGSGLAG